MPNDERMTNVQMLNAAYRPQPKDESPPAPVPVEGGLATTTQDVHPAILPTGPVPVEGGLTTTTQDVHPAILPTGPVPVEGGLATTTQDDCRNCVPHLAVSQGEVDHGSSEKVFPPHSTRSLRGPTYRRAFYRLWESL